MSSSLGVRGVGDCSQLLKWDYLPSRSALPRVGHSLPRNCSRTGIFALEGEDIVGFRAWLGFYSFPFTKSTVEQCDGLGRGLCFEGGCGRAQAVRGTARSSAMAGPTFKSPFD